MEIHASRQAICSFAEDADYHNRHRTAARAAADDAVNVDQAVFLE
jgi:hypothetical protein